MGQQRNRVRLTTEQLIAINYLSLPKRGGKTMDEIATECGVTRKTIYNWQEEPLFEAELKKQMIRNSRARLPEVIAAMSDHSMDGNAAMTKLLLQMNDMLTDQVSVNDKLTASGDVEEKKRRIEEYKKRHDKQG